MWQPLGLVIVDNDQIIFGLASPFLHKFVAFKLISYPISILLLYLDSGINSRIPIIAQFMDLAFSCLVWSCEASGKAQTHIESPPEICCLASADESIRQTGPINYLAMSLLWASSNLLASRPSQFKRSSICKAVRSQWSIGLSSCLPYSYWIPPRRSGRKGGRYFPYNVGRGPGNWHIIGWFKWHSKSFETFRTPLHSIVFTDLESLTSNVIHSNSMAPLTHPSIQGLH